MSDERARTMPTSGHELPEDELHPIGVAGVEEVMVVPWPLLLRRRLNRRVLSSDRYPYYVLFSVLFGLLAVNYTFTIFNVALTTVAKDLKTTESTLTWAITAPLLLVGVAAPTVGKIGDLKGHRRVYLFGLAGAVVCSAFTAVAWNAPSLIVGRLLGGIEGACTTAASWSLLFRVFKPEDRVKILGWWSFVGAGGPVIGVVIGGPVIDHIGWRWIFIAQVPIVLAALALALIVIPETVPSPGQSFDVKGAVLLTVGAGSILAGVNRAPSVGWSDPSVVALFGLAALALVAFVRAEQRARDPLMPLDWFRRRNFAFPVGAQVFMNFAYLGGFFLTPLFLEQAFGYSASHTGALQIARPLVFSITSPVSGYLSIKIGERAAAVAGASCVVASMVLFAGLGASSGDLMIVLALGVSGVGLGLSAPSLAASVAAAVEEHRMGVASAVQQLMVQVGNAIGIQIMVSVQQSAVAKGCEEGTCLIGSFHTSYLVAAGVAVVGVVCAALIRSAPRGTAAPRDAAVPMH